MTSFRNRDVRRMFGNTRRGMLERARFLPIEPTPPHPDTPERNVMLKMLPYKPRERSYIDGSGRSRKSVPFMALRTYWYS